MFETLDGAQEGTGSLKDNLKSETCLSSSGIFSKLTTVSAESFGQGWGEVGALAPTSR